MASTYLARATPLYQQSQLPTQHNRGGRRYYYTLVLLGLTDNVTVQANLRLKVRGFYWLGLVLLMRVEFFYLF